MKHDFLEKDFLERIKAHAPSWIGMDQCKKAAVCIPLIKRDDGSYDILFEIRSSKLAHQPGDICLPGGMVETGETSREGAIRELREELLLSEEQIRFLGDGDKLYTGSNLILSSYIVEVNGYQGTFQASEVEEIFFVPLRFFKETKPDRYVTEAKVQAGEDFPYDLICRGREYQWRKRKEEVYFYQYEGHVIWGMTAKVIKAFSEI